MSRSPADVPDAASRFFDNYLNCLLKASAPERQRRWYMKRLKEFISAHQGRKIRSLPKPALDDYFGSIGREKRLSVWQFRQCIDAILIVRQKFLSPQCKTPAVCDD